MKPEHVFVIIRSQDAQGTKHLVAKLKVGFYLLDVYGTDHCYIRVKCRKCKFDETIDTALFRTIRHRRRKSTRWKLATVRRGMKWKSSV